MILYRFSSRQYGGQLNGEGAKLFGGRWNSIGLPVVYCSTTISLAVLELLVHYIHYDQLASYELMVIEVPDKSIEEINLKQLKHKWQEDFSYSRFIGDEFLKQSSSLLLKVPSSVIPEENNILINPGHKDFGKVKMIEERGFTFDVRLFKK
jgi:Uncharacterized conserved protein